MSGGLPEPPSASLLSPEQVAQRTGLSRKAIYRAIARGELVAYRLCGRLRIKAEEEQAWLERNRVRVEPSSPLAKPSRARPAPPAQGLRRLLQDGLPPTGLGPGGELACELEGDEERPPGQAGGRQARRKPLMRAGVPQDPLSAGRGRRR